MPGRMYVRLWKALTFSHVLEVNIYKPPMDDDAGLLPEGLSRIS